MSEVYFDHAEIDAPVPPGADEIVRLMRERGEDYWNDAEDGPGFKSLYYYPEGRGSEAGILSLLAAVAFAHAEDQPKPGKIVPIPLEGTDKIAVKVGDWNKPTPVSDSDDLKKFVTEPATLKKVMEGVDFKTHILLVFAWQGSGGDKLTAALTDDTPQEVRFTLKPGVTDDLRSHVQLFAVKKEVRWTAK